jgi:hypothetical protein
MAFGQVSSTQVAGVGTADAYIANMVERPFFCFQWNAEGRAMKWRDTMTNFARKAALAAASVAFASFQFGPLAHAQQPTTQQTEQRLQPAGETAENDEFGGAVAISGDRMVIGGEAAAGLGFDTGAAYIFERFGNSWVQTAKLFANDGHVVQQDPTTGLPAPGQHADRFGTGVAISGDTVAIGAPGRTVPGFTADSGTVYVFQLVHGTWIQQAELTAPHPTPNGSFGDFQTLGLSGDTLVVGDPGNSVSVPAAIQVFTRKHRTWTLTATVTVPDDFSFFPDSVAIDGHTLVVGSTSSDTPLAPFAGAVHVFRFLEAQGTWVKEATLTAADAATSSQFGLSVSVSDNVAAVGANNGQTGAAYVFARKDGGWHQEAKLTASDGADFDGFGQSLSVSEARLLVGASGHTTPSGDPFGAAYVYMRREGKWSQIAEVMPSDAIGGGSFGDSVAIQDNTLLIGASNQHPAVEGYAGGESYVYRLIRRGGELEHFSAK